MAATEPLNLDTARMTRAQRATLPLSTDVVQALAEQHGVCVQHLAMRRINTTTGRVEVVPVPCGSTRADQCPPCAEKARRLRMAQCRQGWHLDQEPVTEQATPSEDHRELMATRADLAAAYAECREAGDEDSCEQIAESVAELDTELRSLGVRGRLTPLDPPPKPVKRSTRRRQDAPDLPRRPVEHRTLGRVFAGRYRPSTFLTLTLDSYRPGGHQRSRRQSRHLRLPPRRHPLPRPTGPILAKHPPLCRVGSAVLRHHRTPKTRRTPLPHRHPRSHPPHRAASHRGGDVPSSVVASP